MFSIPHEGENETEYNRPIHSEGNHLPDEEDDCPEKNQPIEQRLVDENDEGGNEKKS